MTLGCFGRTVEGAQQTTGLGVPKGFVATANDRVPKTLKDLQTFNTRLIKLEKSQVATKASTDSHLTTIREIMEAPMPEVAGVEVTGGDLVVPVEKIGGPAFSGEAIMKAGLDFGHGVQSTVLAPLRSWRERLTKLASRAGELEAERLELDMWRRRAGSTQGAVDKDRGQLQSAVSMRKKTKLESKLEANIKALQEREGRVAVLTQSFQEHEAALYADLTTLNKDAGWLKSFVQLGLRAEAQCLEQSATAFGVLPEPPAIAIVQAPTAAAAPAAVPAAKSP